MAKKDTKKNNQNISKSVSSGKSGSKTVSLDDSPFISKFFWIVIPVFTLIYYVSSKYSLGFYQDDEVGQYINMINFFTDPFVILGNSPKPGYKIFMVIPSLFGYNAVLLVNSLIASLAVYFTYILLKTYKINYAYFGALLLAVQPLFFDLSFRSYAEIFTSLLILFVLILYKKESYALSALVCGYIFTVRQEIALLIMIFAVIYFRKKNYTAILMLAVFPLIYNFLGYFKTGDLMFVMSEIMSLSVYSYKSQGISHYLLVYIFIVGPVTLLLFFFGFFGFLSDTNKIKEYLMKYGIFYLVFVSIFSVQLMTMFSDGANPGNWRYLLHISPIAAVFATIGLNNLGNPSFRKTSYILTGVLGFITLVFLSKDTNGFILLETSEYTKFFMIVISFLIILIVKKDPVTEYLNKVSAVLFAIAVIYLTISFKPKELSSENLAMKQTSDYLNTLDLKDREVLYNHTFIPFYSDEHYRKNPSSFKRLISENLKEIKPGSIVIWDSHYSYRPKDMLNDVQLETLEKDSTYKLLNKIISGDQRFGAFIFEKTN
ncbi:MAG TPA: hypothetical protein PK536_08555 [Ignavibacteria bacterium]|nr:hypothetical protein [Ignavibacteria bacterium]HRJ99709.1 hypothetical protein [Ignavibacteria bacterium]